MTDRQASIFRYDRRWSAEMVVDPDFHDMDPICKVKYDARARTLQGIQHHIFRSKINEVVFNLGGEPVPEGPFQSRANEPAGSGLAATERMHHRVRQVRVRMAVIENGPGGATLDVDKGPIKSSVAEAWAHSRDPIHMRRDRVRFAVVRKRAVAVDVSPAVLPLDTDNPIPRELIIEASLDASKKSIAIHATRVGFAVVSVHPTDRIRTPADVAADVESSPAIHGDRRRRRCFENRPLVGGEDRSSGEREGYDRRAHKKSQLVEIDAKHVSALSAYPTLRFIPR